MRGDELRALRERRGMNQPEMATWLNDLTGRRYDRHKISRWEGEREKIPREIEGTLLMAALEQAPADGPRTPLIVALALQKGGTAKTATSVCVAYVLARAGRSVLLVDADSQGNATIHVGIEKDEMLRLTRDGRTHYHTLVGKAAIDDVILRTPYPNLDILPSSIALAHAETDLQQDKFGPLIHMREMLATVQDRYDFIIIDCAPVLGMVTLNAFAAADCLLVPCQTEAFAVLALEDLYQTIDTVQKRTNPHLKVLGIVPTLYNPRQTQDRASLDDIQRLWGGTTKIYEPIPRAAVYAQASAAHAITLAGDPGAPGLESYLDIAKDLMEVADRRREAAHGA